MGGGDAYVTTLLTSVLTVTPGVESVNLSWTEVTPPEPGTPVTYYIRRDGGAPSAGCPAEGAPSTVLTCTDTGLLAGSTHTYTVVAVWRSWRVESEARSATVLSGGEATQFALSAARSEVKAGEADPLTITALNAAGQRVSTFSGVHNLTFSGASATATGSTPTVTSEAGGAISFGAATPITFSEGTATVSGTANGLMTLYRAELAHIEVAEGALSNAGALLAVNVTAGAFKSFAVTPSPAEPHAGSQFSVTLTAQDAWQNIITTYARTGKLTYSGAEASPAPASTAPIYAAQSEPAFAEGKATINGFTFYKAAPTTLTVQEAGTGNAGSGTFNVAPAAASHLALSAAATAVKVGETDALSITALDAWDNVATSFGGAAGESESLTFSGARPGPNGTAPTVSSESGTAVAFGTPTPIRFVAGKATVSGTANGLMALYMVEEAHIKVAAGAISNEGALLAITVSPGPAKSFRVSQPIPGEAEEGGEAEAGAVEAGQAFGLTLAALDAGGNVATSFGGAAGEAKALTYSGPESSPNGTAPTYPATATGVTFREGVGTASGIRLYKAAATTLTVTSGAVAGSVAFTVLAGPAQRLTWTEPAISAGTLGSPCDVTCIVEGLGSEGTFTSKVSVADRYGNPQTTHRGTIEVDLSATLKRGTGTGSLSTTTLTIAPGSATSGSFTFTAPKLEVRRTRRGFRTTRYTYELSATARGYSRANSARATLHS
ncbi:MAG: fibronectin type III domain-containing protein [Solirubrobacteraceae bacterium]